MSLTGEKLIQNFTPAQLRGRDAYCNIREAINAYRWRGLEFKCVWVSKHTDDDMKALWARACGPEWDQVTPKLIAGIPVKVGSTGGADYILERFETQALAEGCRQAMNKMFKPSDNPLYGTH